MKNSLPLYRHHRLYSCNKRYQEYKYVDKDKFYRMSNLLCEISDQKEKGRNEYSFDEAFDKHFSIEGDDVRLEECAPCCVESDSDKFWDYNLRYSSLNHCGYFWHNLSVIEDLIEKSMNLSEFRIKCTIRGIDEEKANYGVFYMFMEHDRFFSYDYENIAKLKKKMKGCTLDYRIAESYKRWSVLTDIYKDIAKHNRKVSSFTDFSKELI